MAPFKGTGLASCVASGNTEIQGHSQVWRSKHWGPRTLSWTIDKKLDCVFVENALVYLCQKLGRPRPPLYDPLKPELGLLGWVLAYGFDEVSFLSSICATHIFSTVRIFMSKFRDYYFWKSLCFLVWSSVSSACFNVFSHTYGINCTVPPYKYEVVYSALHNCNVI